jgi:DHA1 family bicyclomycin/chloramphenicol resistance-like MFS transporter
LTPTPPPPSTDGRTPLRLLVLLTVMTGMSSMSLTLLVPAMPGLVSVFATDPNAVQLTVTLYLVGLAVSQLLLGPLSDKFGRRPVVLAGLALATVASCAAIFVSTIGGLIVARVAQSFGASTGQVIGRAIIRDLYERDRAASMIGLITSVMVLVPMFSPLVGGVLDTAFGYVAIFVFAAAASFAVLAWALAILPETRKFNAPGEPSHFLTDLRALVASTRFFGYVLVAALGSGPFFTLLGAGPYVVVNIHGRTSAEYGLWFVVAAFGFMVGNFMVSRLTVRLGIHVMIVWGIVATIVGAVLCPLLYLLIPGWEMWTIFVPQAIVGLGNGLLLPTAIAGAVSTRPQIAGTASGITGFTQMAIAAIAAQVAGYAIAGASNAMPMLWIIVAFGIATAVSYAALVGWRPGTTA